MDLNNNQRGRRLSFRRRAAVALLGLSATLLVYAFWVEPYRVEVSHHRVAMPLARPIRVCNAVAPRQSFAVYCSGQTGPQVLSAVEQRATIASVC